MAAYYNEIEPFAAAWLRELIKRDLIAPGDVDERSITDVQPDDVRGYTQCHFFAGIGVWSYALFNAGWSDSDPVWTGSCPCQPFSASGKGEGFDDPRHLWPHWFRLIRECRPELVFGEQVERAILHGWLDVVSADLESEGYAVGSAVLGAHSVGAPHVRQRLYWVADASSGSREQPHRYATEWRRQGDPEQAGMGGRPRELAQPGRARAGRDAGAGAPEEAEGNRERFTDGIDAGNTSLARGATASAVGLSDRGERDGGLHEGPQEARGAIVGRSSPRPRREHAIAPSPLGGFWRDAEWLPCADGRARPIEPGTFPLVTGAPARLVRLRGYGNAVNAEQAKAFIEAYLDVCEER